MKNIVLDSQVLTALMNCPRLADFRFNKNLIPIAGKSNSIECGSIFHKFAEVYYRSLIDGLSKEQATQFGLTAAELYIQGCPDCTGFIPTEETPKPTCGHTPDEYPGVVNTPKDSVGYKTGWQHVLDTCEEYANFYRNDHWVPLEVESVKAKVLYQDDEIRILWKAKLDLIADTNQGIFPVDHKTMRQRRDTVSLNNQFIGQALLMDSRNVIINKIGWQKSLPASERFIRSVLSFSASRLIEWQAEILPFYTRLYLMYMETGYFPPQFGHCEGKYGGCAFIGVCECDPDMREEELKHNFKLGPEWSIEED